MSLTDRAREAITARLRHLQTVRDRVTIDSDTHPSSPALYSDALRRRLAEDPNYFHGRPISGDELLRDMDHSGVDMALCWQNPAVTTYVNDQHENFAILRAVNAGIAELARQHPPGDSGGLDRPEALARRARQTWCASASRNGVSPSSS